MGIKVVTSVMLPKCRCFLFIIWLSCITNPLLWVYRPMCQHYVNIHTGYISAVYWKITNAIGIVWSLCCNSHTTLSLWGELNIWASWQTEVAHGCNTSGWPKGGSLTLRPFSKKKWMRQESGSKEDIYQCLLLSPAGKLVAIAVIDDKDPSDECIR